MFALFDVGNKVFFREFNSGSFSPPARLSGCFFLQLYELLARKCFSLAGRYCK